MAFQVIDLDATTGKGRDCGEYETLDEARGCVEYDGLNNWEICQGDRFVESSAALYEGAHDGRAARHADGERDDQEG